MRPNNHYVDYTNKINIEPECSSCKIDNCPIRKMNAELEEEDFDDVTGDIRIGRNVKLYDTFFDSSGYCLLKLENKKLLSI